MSEATILIIFIVSTLLAICFALMLRRTNKEGARLASQLQVHKIMNSFLLKQTAADLQDRARVKESLRKIMGNQGVSPEIFDQVWHKDGAEQVSRALALRKSVDGLVAAGLLVRK